MKKSIRKNPFYWASRLILDYHDTIENPEFRSLNKDLKIRAIHIFHDQNLIKMN